MRAWPQVRLADICGKPQYGAIARGSGKSVGPLFVRQTDIASGRIDWASVPYCDLDAAEFDKYALKPGDLLISRLGNGVGNAATVSETRDAVFAGYLVRFQAITSVACSKFLGYQLQSTAWRQHVAGFRSGAAQPTLNAQQMGDFRFTLPPILVQRGIAATLGAIDDKIESDRRAVRGLQRCARAIFEAWFIDFAPHGGEKPADWRDGTFSDIVDTTMAGDWGKDSSSGGYTQEVYCVRGADIPAVNSGNKGKMPLRYVLPKNFVAKQLAAGYIVIETSGGSPTQSTGRGALVTPSLLDRYEYGMVCTNFCRALKPARGYSEFIYFYWRHLYENNVMFAYENGTTGVKNLDIASLLKSEPIVIPPIEIAVQFAWPVEALLDRLFATGMEIERLTTLRDTLLPELLSGRICVPEASEAVGDVVA